MRVPFNRPYITGNELKYIRDIIKNIGNKKISGDGEYTKKVDGFLESRFGAKKALMTTSCTSSLELATHILDIKNGDEVILPSYTFASTANAVMLSGAKPVFADIEEDTLNIDPEDVERRITPRTKAIYPVHYGGISCDMGRLMNIADEHDLAVVEDAAQGVNAKYNGKYLGTLGDLGCYSFHETKNYVCGEGGALLINVDDPKILERAEIIREKGTDRSRFIRGEVDKYSWMDVGSSYLPSDILAAFLYAQLEKLDEIQKKRMRVWKAYYKALKPYEKKGFLRLPVVPDYAEHNAHLFYLLLGDQTKRDSLMTALGEHGVNAVFHYLPLHTSPMGARFGYKKGDLPKTEDLSLRLLRLPIYAGMTKEEREYTLDTLTILLEEYDKKDK